MDELPVSFFYCVSPELKIGISSNSSDLSGEFEPPDQIQTDQDKPIKLKEWKTYYLRFYSELSGEILKYYPELELFKDGFDDTFIQEKIGDIYKINFQNYVGLSRIGPIKLEILNQKINKEQYQSLLSCITERYIDLVYQFSRTKEKYGQQGVSSQTGFAQIRNRVGNNTDYVNFLFLKKMLLDTTKSQASIKEILALITKEPHYKIEREFTHTPVELASHIDPNQLIQAITSGNNLEQLSSNHDHGLAQTSLALKLKNLSTRKTAYFPINIKEEKKYHSFDTAENRFIKYFLEDLLQLLVRLKQQFSSIKTYFNPEFEEDIKHLINPIKNCLEHHFWREVSPMRFIPTNSQVLQRKEGYRQLLSLYSLMQLASRYDFNNKDFKNLVESKDTNILYEYWCFFMVKDILDEQLEQLEQAVSSEQLVNEKPEETDQRMQDGAWVYYKDGTKLGFNITFNSTAGILVNDFNSSNHLPNESYSRKNRPDIVIKFEDKYLILDAKHKRHMWDGEGNPKKEDIDKMHTYRDAIQYAVGAFTLYPGNKSVIYPIHDARFSYEGVGALSLIPDNSKNGQSTDKSELVSLICKFIEN